jgi:hypothetical protein
MNDTKINDAITSEGDDKLQLLDISDEMRAFIRSTSNKPLSQLMPKKHQSVLTSLVNSKVIKLHKENPNMPIKKVITTIFEPLTDDIPAPLMLKLTQKIIEDWTALSQKIRQDKTASVAV